MRITLGDIDYTRMSEVFMSNSGLLFRYVHARKKYHHLEFGESHEYHPSNSESLSGSTDRQVPGSHPRERRVSWKWPGCIPLER